MLGRLIDQMLTEQKKDVESDEKSISSNDYSLESEDFIGDSLNEYLKGQYNLDAGYNDDGIATSRGSIRISELQNMSSDSTLDATGVQQSIKRKSMQDSWITHTPKKEKEVGNWRSAAADLRESTRGNVLQRAQMFDASKKKDKDTMGEDPNDTIDNTLSPLNTPTYEGERSLGSSMSSLLTPSKFYSPQPGLKNRFIGAEYAQTPMLAAQNLSIIDNIECYSTPKPQEIRMSFEVGSAFSGGTIPKLKPLKSAEGEGIKEKIAKLGILERKEEESKVKEYPEKAVDFAAQRYVLHASATKIQALARGYLYRKKDSEATMKVIKWLQQHQDIEQMLTAEDVTEEEREKAMMTLTEHIQVLTSHMRDDLIHDDSSSFASNSFASDGSDFEAIDDAEREEKASVSEIGYIEKSMNISDIMSAFDKPINDADTLMSPRSSKNRLSMRNRLLVLEQAVIKIQTVSRGFLARKSNYGAAIKALEWLKEYKLLDELQKRKKSKVAQFSEDKLLDAIATINEVQDQLHQSATKIQATGRGYIVRKFDMKKMMGVVQWIRKAKIEIDEAQTPEKEELEIAWVFLEENNKWTRAGHGSADKSCLSPKSQVFDSGQYFNIDELVNTWEWMEAFDSRAKEVDVENKSKPDSAELTRLYNWVVQNEYPYSPPVSTTGEKLDVTALLAEPKNADDLVRLWEYLEANGMNVNVLREGDDNGDNQKQYSIHYIGEDLSDVYNNSKEDSLIQYIDEDLSEVYKSPVPSISAMLDYWRFSQKHGTEVIVESAKTRKQKTKHEALEAVEEVVAPGITEHDDVESIESVEEETSAKAVEKSKYEDKSEDEEDSISDATEAESISSEETPPKRKTLPSKRRRMPANIDSMMTSFRWMKKKGVRLNRVRPGQAPIPNGKIDEADEISSTSNESPSVSVSDMESTLAWLKEKEGSDDWESKLVWLDNRVFDPYSKKVEGSDVEKGSDLAKCPPTTFNMAAALRWLNHKGRLRKSPTFHDAKEIIFSLAWLQKKGYDLDEAAEAIDEVEKNVDRTGNSSVPSVEGMMIAFGAVNEADKIDGNFARKTVPKTKKTELSYKEMEVALDWLTKRGISKARSSKVTPSLAKRSNTRSSKKKDELHVETHGKLEGPKMLNALSWLEQKGYDVKRKAMEKISIAPTVEEAAATIKVIEQKQRRSSEDGTPSNQEMEDALNWLSLRDEEKKQKKKKKIKSPSSFFKGNEKKEKKASSKKKRKSSTLSSENMHKALAYLQKAGKVKSDQKKKIGLHKTVDLMKYKLESQRSFPPKQLTRKKVEKHPVKKDIENIKSGSSDYENAFEWILTKSDECQDAVYYKKLHKMLPGKGNQSNERRATEMVKALKWVKRQGLMGSVKENSSSTTENNILNLEPTEHKAKSRNIVSKVKKEKLSKRVAMNDSKKSPKPRKSGPTLKEMMKKQKKKAGISPRKSNRNNSIAAAPSMKDMLSPRKSKKKNGAEAAEIGAKDFDLALAWLTSKDESLEEAKYFKKLDSMVPKNSGQSAEERAKELVKALNWVRRTHNKKNESIEAEEGTKPANESKVSTQKMKAERHSTIRRKSIVTKKTKSPTHSPKDSKKKKSKKVDKEKMSRTTIALKDLMKVQAKAEKKDVRKKGKRKKADSDVDAEEAEESKLGPSPENDFENALAFIKVKEGGGDTMKCEDANSFKKLDNMLPRKVDQGSEDRAKEMVKMLGWLRKKGKI
jgi:hypothetical protein